MLEETLKLINQNLERIANALEPKDIDTVELPKVQNMTVQTTPISQVAQQVEIVQSDDVQPAVVASKENIQTTVQPVVPVTPVSQSFTQEQLAVAMSNAVATGKMDLVRRILQSFNVQALTQIKPEDYNKLATMLKEQGVEI